MNSINTNYEYLIAIYTLSRQLPAVRSIDVAHLKEISKPTVSIRMKILKQRGYISMDSKGIYLTTKGIEIAETLNKKYKLFKTLLKTIGLNDKDADEIAYYAAQTINHQSFKDCSDYLEKVTNPSDKPGICRQYLAVSSK